jgi:hypothetical protein
MMLCSMGFRPGRSHIPLLSKEGCSRPLEMSRSHLCWERTGWLSINNHPACALKGTGPFYLLAQSPLLEKEGNVAFDVS